MTSKTNLSVGDKIWFETGGTGSTVGGVANSLTQAYITSISSTDNNITVSEDVQVIASGLAVTGWLSDKTSGLLPAADSDTNKVGKDFSIAVKTEEDTEQIVLYISNKSTTTNVIELFFDGILVSQNKFLQASSQLKSEYYYAPGNSNFWNDLSSNSGWDADLVVSGFGAPPVAQSKFLRFEETSTTDTRVYARQDIDLAVTFTGHDQAGNQIKIYNSDGEILAQQQTPDPAGHVQNNSVTVSMSLAKDDYMYCVNDRGSTASNRYGAATFLATGRNSDVILLESQDEIFTDWIVYTPTITGGANGANTQWRYRRVGGEMEIQALYYHTSAGTADWSFSLPEGYVISNTAGPTSTDHLSAGLYIIDQTNAGNHGGCLLYLPGGTAIFRGNDQLYNSSGTFNPLAPVAGTAGAGGTNVFWSINAKVPIQGWNSNFNPLLSMPLVEIGSDCEYYNFRNVGNPSSGKTYRFLARSTGTEVINTIDKLGTVTNDTTNGWYFQASQRVKVHFHTGFACSTTGAGFGIVKLSDHPSTYSDNPWGNSQWDSLYVGGGQDTRTGGGYQGAASASFIMEPGEYLQAVSDNTNFQSSTKSGLTLLVEKDRSNTNMAHIIKPAVATLKNVLAYNANGGATSAGSFEKIPLNTVEGESWFVTLNDSTDVFTLEPGTYEIDAVQPLVKPDRATVVIFDEDNSTFPIVGTSNYFDNSNVVAGESSLRGTISITTSTQFSFKYRVSNAHSEGLGENINASEINSIYGQVKIRKLK